MLTPLKKVILIFVLTLVAAYISLPKETSLFDKKFTRPDVNLKLGRFTISKSFDLVLGLDLAGGSHLVFEADTNQIPEGERNTAVESLKKTIERRVNLFGISEPNVQTSSFEGKERVIVELPGVRDTKEAINLIGATAQLVFGEVFDMSDGSFDIIAFAKILLQRLGFGGRFDYY